MRKLVFWLLFLIFCTSCVTNRKIQYLQNDDVNIKALHTDTTLRYYAISASEYRIQEMDILSVQVESLTQNEYNFFSKGQGITNLGNLSESGAAIIGELVDGNGEIELPVVGKIKVAGLSVFETQDYIQQIANKYLQDAVVKVRILNFRFTILGEVRREGTINSFNYQISIPEALGLAGGVTDLADRSKVKLIRNRGDRIEVQYLNLLEENLLESPYYHVHQKDILVVPPLKQRPFKTNFGSNFGIVLSAASTLLLVINLLQTP